MFALFNIDKLMFLITLTSKVSMVIPVTTF